MIDAVEKIVSKMFMEHSVPIYVLTLYVSTCPKPFPCART